VNLAGNQGETLGNESVEAVREIVDRSHPPAGVKAYVTGQAPLTADMTEAGDKSMVKITVITIAVITVMLLIVYRSVLTTLLILFVVLIEMSAARGVVAVVGHFGLLGLSTSATSLLTSLAIAAGTDYAIFLVGRYQEARQSGQEREDAYYTAFHGVGAAAVTCPLYLAEMAPAERRGRMVTVNELMIVTGQMLAFAMNALLDHLIRDPHVWRTMLAVAAVPAIALFFGMLVLPDSPRWYGFKGRMAEARDVLALSRSPREAEDEYRLIVEQPRTCSRRPAHRSRSSATCRGSAASC
jgi:MFS family permease